MLVGIAVAVAATGLTGAATASAAEGAFVPAPAGQGIADQYVVVLKGGAGVDPAATALAGKFGGKVTATWRHALHGFAIHTGAAGARALAGDTRVAAVYQDARVSADTVQVNPPSWTGMPAACSPRRGASTATFRSPRSSHKGGAHRLGERHLWRVDR